MGFFDKIKAGLAKTRDALSDSWNELFSGIRKSTMIFTMNWKNA